jgi:hypothetical protein
MGTDCQNASFLSLGSFKKLPEKRAVVFPPRFRLWPGIKIALWCNNFGSVLDLKFQKTIYVFNNFYCNILL